MSGNGAEDTVQDMSREEMVAKVEVHLKGLKERRDKKIKNHEESKRRSRDPLRRDLGSTHVFGLGNQIHGVISLAIALGLLPSDTDYTKYY